MFDKTAVDLAELAAEYHEQHCPASPTERELVDTLIYNERRLRRMRRVEAVLWEHAAAYLGEHPESDACNSADAFVANSGQLVARGHARRSPQPENSTPTSPIWARSVKIRRPPPQPPPNRRPPRPLPLKIPRRHAL